MITDSQTAERLAQQVRDTGNTSFLLVVFPENGQRLLMKDLDIATNANNETVIEVARLLATMLATGQYQQEILNAQDQLGWGDPQLPK